MECQVCHNNSDGLTAKFCSQCGTKYPRKKDLPYIGTSKNKGIFQITFAPVEDEFADKDAAEDAARHSVWSKDRPLTAYTVECIRSTVTAETHPFICGECGRIVAERTTGKCENCGRTDWVRRIE